MLECHNFFIEGGGGIAGEIYRRALNENRLLKGLLKEHNIDYREVKNDNSKNSPECEPE